MPAILSPKPKRIKAFISPNGQIYEGGAEEYYTGNHLGRTGSPSGVPEKTEGDEEKKS